MTQIYCDIVPQANGWCFISEEGQSPVYPTYRLAVDAARSYCHRKIAKPKETVIRQQDLRGRMLVVSGKPQAWGPDALADLSRGA